MLVLPAIEDVCPGHAMSATGKQDKSKAQLQRWWYKYSIRQRGRSRLYRIVLDTRHLLPFCLRLDLLCSARLRWRSAVFAHQTEVRREINPFPVYAVFSSHSLLMIDFSTALIEQASRSRMPGWRRQSCSVADISFDSLLYKVMGVIASRGSKCLSLN